MMLTSRLHLTIGAVLLSAACASEDNIRDRVELPDALGEVLDAAGDTPVGETGVDAQPSETRADGGLEVAETTADTGTPGDAVSDSEAADGATSDAADTADVPVAPWEVDLSAAWALGRPIPIASTEGNAEIGAPVTSGGRYAAIVPVRIGSGAVLADGRSFAAPDAGGHAALVALSGDLLAPTLGTVVYLDGPLSLPERPSTTVCGSWVYASVNEQNGSAARLVRLSTDLEAIDIAQFAALPGLGHSVRLGAPVCGGPGLVVTLDAVGGASFTAPDGTKSEFNSGQTENKTLILNGTRVFEENAAQVVSATSMRILQLVAGAQAVVFYVGEATVQRQVGDTTLMPGDQLVYNHDFALGTGGSIASQGWFGREDIALVATAANGRFAVAWVDVTAGPTPGDPELVELVVSVFEADGARAWNKRSAAWAIDRIAFDPAGDLRIAGRFRSLEAIGVATAPVGLEDVFLAVLAGPDGARKRHVVLGVAGAATTIAGSIFSAVGSGPCAAAGALDAVIAVTGTARVGVGVGSGLRCATEALGAGDGVLQLGAPATVVADATDFWLAFAGPALSAGGASWPAGGANVGPLRVRFVSPL